MIDTSEGGTLGERTVEDICSIPGVRMMTAADIPEDVKRALRDHLATAIDLFITDEIVRQVIKAAKANHD